MVASRLVDWPDSPEAEEMGPIPEMMFAAGEEPVGLVMVEAVPALTEVVQDIGSSSESETEELERSCRDLYTKKQTLNPAHGRNVDKRTNVSDALLLVPGLTDSCDYANYDWSDEEADAKVDNLVSRIAKDFEFQTSSFRGGGGVKHCDVERMREVAKSASRGRKASKVQPSAQLPDPVNVADLVIDKITPKLEFMDANIKTACSSVAEMEGKVVGQVYDLLAKFKEEMLACVKAMVDSTCKAGVGPSDGPPNKNGDVAPEASGEGTRRSLDDDANANAIQNVRSNLSEYSTPPRANQKTQATTSAGTSNGHIDSGFVSKTPVVEHGAQSANSGNRSRQNSFQQSLEQTRLADTVAEEPSFSLGLTQEYQKLVPGNNDPNIAHPPETEEAMNVDDNIGPEQASGNIKSRRRVEENDEVEPLFSLGLMQEELNEGNAYVVGAEVAVMETNSAKNVGEKMEQPHVSRKKLERKYASLCSKLRSKVVVNVAGLFVSGKDISLIVERSRFFPAKVMDILIRVERASLMQHMNEQSPGRVQFIDTKFVPAVNRLFPKFSKSRDKHAYRFPAALSALFPTADATHVHPTRYYLPYNIGNKHWLGLCFDAADGVLTVLDCNISLFRDSIVEKNLNSLLLMLPYLARFACQAVGEDPIIQCFDVVRPRSVAQINNSLDSGLMSLLLMGRHALYGIESCKNISHHVLEEESRWAAISTYEFKGY
ncbi:Ulp1 protease family [Hirschfeldia incana]|nr:Ulp1 protease family [Hirschfeldia incana]